MRAVLYDGKPPGNQCTYDPASRTITRIRSRAPQAFAVNTTAGLDHQDVAIRARAQRLVAQPGGGSASKRKGKHGRKR